MESCNPQFSGVFYSCSVTSTICITSYMLHEQLEQRTSLCSLGSDSNCYILHRGADKSLARPGRNQARATEDFDVHISYL